MSSTAPQSAVLSIQGDASPAGSAGLTLQGVDVQARLDGLLLRTTLQQRYRNSTGRLVETVYTFPLAHGASLLGLSVTLGDKKMSGAVIEKQEATQRYEQAIDAGDTPVLVEQSSPGLYTANLGNLQDGEEATIELEYAQLLRFEQGGLRLSIPTVVAPRYGQPQAQGGLAPHESTEADWQARYPFTLTLDIGGPAAKARLSSPSHRIEVQPVVPDQGAPGQGETVRVTLGQGGWLDRDFVLRLDGLEGQAFCVTAQDGDETLPQAQAVLASFCPRLPAQELVPLSLKILVDCSGSMTGDSIEQARRALHEVGQWLEPTDRIAYFRFGNQCVPVIPTLEPCTPKLVARYAKAIEQTEADLGGTELQAALLQVFGPKSKSATKADVLLITDGEVWDIEPTVKAARDAGHRLFVVGVSSSPAESLLRELAEQSGGACELVTPNEDIAGAITRMVRRLRAARDIGLELDWGQPVLWQSPLPPQVFDGETLHVWARLEQPLQAAPTLHWSAAGATGSDQAHQVQADASGTTARLCGARQADTLTSDENKLALALRYQLVTRQTSLFLVHQRAESEKAEGLPALKQIRHMMAAGHGGFGSVTDSSQEIPAFLRRQPEDMAPCSMVLQEIAVPSIWRKPARSLGRWADKLRAYLETEPDEPGLATLDEGQQAESNHKLMLAAFEREAATPQAAQRHLDQLQAGTTDPQLQALLDQLALIADDRTAAALLLDWLNRHLSSGPALSRQAERVLRSVLKPLSPEVRAEAEQAIEAALPGLWLAAGG
ncbi:VIT domain-containing protein [Malikia spinosa]|uniref:VIT domain-containing protein n=1 Tax=Malikia spinosa TaxID=86180 RepID=UPI003FA1C2F8